MNAFQSVSVPLFAASCLNRSQARWPRQFSTVCEIGDQVTHAATTTRKRRSNTRRFEQVRFQMEAGSQCGTIKAGEFNKTKSACF